VAICAPVEAQSPSRIVNVEARHTTSLNGKWRAIVDPYENGYYDFRLQPSMDGYFLDAKPKDKSDRIEYDFDTSGQLDVPGDWNTQRESLFFYEGTVWYRKTFDYQGKPATRLFLDFGAANYEAIVYLNGEKLGSHTGGFTPFEFEITGRTREKGNSVVVKVDNKRHREAVPTVNTDWWNYGGLTRGVSLVEVPETFVEDYFVQLKKGSTDTIAGWVRLNGPRPRQQVAIRIPEAGVSASVATDANGYAVLDVPAKLTLWSPENPKLYEVTIASDTDSVRDRIGFRTIETKGTDILLNGKPVFLRGVSIHEEAPFRSGRAYSPEDARTLLGWAKEMGCNFVRLAHYPHNENMVREADRLGLMVWSEIPVYWTILWENPETFANASNQLAENIARDKNRASIVLWSVANETPVGDARTAFLRKLAQQVRSLDPTRLVTAALLHHNDGGAVEGNTDLLDDPLGADLDVLGCNEYLGWYDGLPDKADHMDYKTIYTKPLIMSEFGADALYGLHGDPLTRWTEEYQENVFRHQVGMLRRIPFLRGTSPWVLMDFRSPRRTLPDIQDFFNRKGLVSVRGGKKKAFYVMQEFYQAKQKEYQ
jgi:beta-glucuronidase